MKQDNMPQVAKFWNDIAEDFDAIYTGKKSGFARFLDRHLRKDIYQRFEWVMEKVGDPRGKTVCDIGCGSGRFVAEFAKRGAEHVTGVDVAPEMLRLSKALVEKEGVADCCDFVLSDSINWKTDQKFDTTIAIGFWDYIMEPPERLRKMRQVTKGQFLTAWPRFWTWRMPVRKVRLQYIQGCPVYFFRKPQVVKMIEDAGFKVVSVDTVGKLFCVEARPV
jgi:ubiquinone/menaquinone biosynthesis C-methylase UbiE